MKQSIKQPALFLWIFVLLLFSHQVALSQTKQFTGKNITHLYHDLQRQPDPISKYLRKYAVFSLDLVSLAAYVKSRTEKTQFVLNLATQQYHLDLELNDLRGTNYKAVAMTDKGSSELAQTFATTYKGIEMKNPSSIVRLNIDESTFEGYIKIGKSWFYVDKLSRYLPHETKDKIVVYEAADVISDPTKKCGAEMLKAESKRFEGNISNATLTGNCHFLEIATEADYEYYQALGSNADVALNRIRNILNLVEGVYTPAFNVKFILRYQQIWTTVDDPYSGESLLDIFPQFTNWWNTNKTSISRDETQLFTGRVLQDNIIGLAFVSTICNSTYYYSSVANYSPISNITIALSAHEFGHNFGAEHDATCNNRNIMCPYIQNGTPEWSSQSLTEISNYINSSGSCMTESIPDDINYNGNGITYSYLKVVAGNTISINSSPGAVTLTPTGFGYLEAGAGIVLSSINANSLGFLAPEGSVLLMRISDVINSCDPLPLTVVSKPSSSTALSRNVQTLTTQSAIQVFPNPFSSVFELIITLKDAKRAQLTIYNSLGVKVKENQVLNLVTGLNKISVNGSSLAKGVYLVELQIGDVKMIRKLVKM